MHHAGVNVNPKPGTRWGFVANYIVISNINHGGLEILTPALP